MIIETKGGMQMTRYVAGLDVGGTSGRVKIAGVDGSEIGEYYGLGCSINTAGRTRSEAVYRELVLAALHEFDLSPEGCRGICIAASGVDSPELEQLCREIFIGMGFAESAVIVQNDCEIFLNLPGNPSLVLIAGTGSICYGRTGSKEVFRSGGWNHILSDEGSAFGIGLDVLRHAGNHLDGREFCPVLCRGVQEKTGAGSLYDLDRYVNDNLMDKGIIGGFASLAEQSFQAGEPAGAAVLDRAANDLFLLVRDTCRKMGLGEEDKFSLWLWGSVLLKCLPLRTGAEHLLTGCYPEISIKVPPQTALEIALHVALSRAGIQEGQSDAIKI